MHQVFKQMLTDTATKNRHVYWVITLSQASSLTVLWEQPHFILTTKFTY